MFRQNRKSLLIRRDIIRYGVSGVTAGTQPWAGSAVRRRLPVAARRHDSRSFRSELSQRVAAAVPARKSLKKLGVLSSVSRNSNSPFQNPQTRFSRTHTSNV
ncbi:unnamed protein product, partial [Brenthis ino]